MIGIDTNVLVRFIVQDDPQQAAAASRVIESGCTREEPGQIALVVLCELVWVLRGAYGYGPEAIADVLETVLATAELQVERADLARRATRRYRAGKADFADHLIALVHADAGARHTVTFDKSAAKAEGFALLRS